MAKRMLVDAAHKEETRVVVLNGSRLEEFDFESSTKKQIKGNIYLAKVTRVEPSLQAAFVEYGGNRHGFLAFSEIHPDYYRIPVADRQAALAAERAAEHAANAREDAERDRNGHEDGHHARHRFADERGAEPEFADESGAEPAFDDEPEDERAAERMAHEAPGETMRAPLEASRSDAPEFSSETPAAAEFFAVPDPEPRTESSPDMPAEPADPDRGERFGSGEAGDTPDMSGRDLIARLADTVPDERSQPSDDGEGDTIETVGGDEIEETTRPRARPFRHYKIQEVIKRRQIMLVQVVKEERGNKGAALTTYLSLAGRYCVLMPNTPRGGGVSRKITNNIDRRRLKELVGDLDVPEGMGVIVRTAGSERSKTEIKRDFEYLMRLWDEIRDLTLKSTAPALIYEEGNLIKRSIRDLYTRDIDEVVVDGDEGYRTAKAFMKMLMPSHAKRVKPYRDPGVPLFLRAQVEAQIDAIHSPTVQLRSGGYIVINPTEALVAIDVNSGRSTKERNIEETALKTNLEAAEEIARQLRLRDLAGLIVIDFIDMEEYRNRGAVERRLKEAMRYDRARIQLGRISPFGLLELSRQRLRPSLVEASTQPCPFCNGSGHIRSIESTALHVLRAIEEEGMRRRSAEITLAVPSKVALYILNQKRAALTQAEARFGFGVTIGSDDTLVPPDFRLERVRALTPEEIAALPQFAPPPPEPEDEDEDNDIVIDEDEVVAVATEPSPPPSRPEPRDSEDDRSRGRRRGGRRGGHEGRREHGAIKPPPAAAEAETGFAAPEDDERDEAVAAAHEPRPSETRPADARPGEPREARPGDHGSEAERNKRRRRGRRGGRRRRREGPDGGAAAPQRGEFPAHDEGLDAPAAISAEHPFDSPAPADTVEFLGTDDAPEAETIELVPPAPTHEEAAGEVAEAFAASRAAPDSALGTASIPVAEAIADAVEPAAAPVPAEQAERPPAHVEAEPRPAAPPPNPRRGWWRR